MGPLISVIIPVYNSEKYIKDTVQSCLDQSYEKLEIIIVNDGSSDNSEKIILGFRDSRIKYYKIQNSGPCIARNYGISQARGELLQFLDADDILDRKKFQKQLKFYFSYGAEYVYSGIMGCIEKDIQKLEPDFDFYYKHLEVEEYFEKMFTHFGKYYTTGMWLVPRKLVEATHGWNDRVKINNDGEYFSRIILHSKGIIFCPEAIFYYRRDVPMSVSKQLNSKTIYESWLYSYRCYVKSFQEKLSPNYARRLGRKALSVYYCNSYPHYPDLLKECKIQLKNLGFSTPVPYGGKTFRMISTLVGVDNALRIRTFKDKQIKNQIF